MKIRWRNGKAQIVAYVSERGRCEVIDESDDLHELMVKHGLVSDEDEGEDLLEDLFEDEERMKNKDEERMKNK